MSRAILCSSSSRCAVALGYGACGYADSAVRRHAPSRRFADGQVPRGPYRVRWSRSLCRRQVVRCEPVLHATAALVPADRAHQAGEYYQFGLGLRPDEVLAKMIKCYIKTVNRSPSRMGCGRTRWRPIVAATGLCPGARFSRSRAILPSPPAKYGVPVRRWKATCSPIPTRWAAQRRLRDGSVHDGLALQQAGKKARGCAEIFESVPLDKLQCGPTPCPHRGDGDRPPREERPRISCVFHKTA